MGKTRKKNTLSILALPELKPATFQNKSIILLAILSFTFFISNAQTHTSNVAKKHNIERKRYDWASVINIAIDRNKYPGKYKAIEDILNNMAGDSTGSEIFENIAKNNEGKVLIKDKEDVLQANTMEGVNGMFSADFGIQVIKQDEVYDPIDNDLVINFGKSGEMLSFDEQKHQFFKISLNSTIATQLVCAGSEQSPAEKNCRRLIAAMNPDEKFLFDNYKDLMGEKFSNDDIEHCRSRKIAIHSFKTNTDDTYTFTDKVTDALKAYRDFAEAWKQNAYAMNARAMLVARKYTDKLGEPHISDEPVFTIRLGENRSRSLQFGPITGTDYIALDSGEHNVYKNLSVFYDNDDKQNVDNATALTRIKEEYMAQLKYNTQALNSPKMLEYVDRLKKYFNKDYEANTGYKAIMEEAVANVLNNNPYLEGANRVIEAEIIWAETKEMKTKK